MRFLRFWHSCGSCTLRAQTIFFSRSGHPRRPLERPSGQTEYPPCCCVYVFCAPSSGKVCRFVDKCLSILGERLMSFGAKVEVLRGLGHLRAPSAFRVRFWRPLPTNCSLFWGTFWAIVGDVAAFFFETFFRRLSGGAFGRLLGEKVRKRELWGRGGGMLLDYAWQCFVKAGRFHKKSPPRRLRDAI